MLRTEEDFVILDFEGDPAQSIEERRAKQSPLKDVAGMIAVVRLRRLRGAVRVRRARAADYAALEPWAGTWERWAADAFLKGYLADAADATPLLPRDPRARDAAVVGLHARQGAARAGLRAAQPSRLGAGPAGRRSQTHPVGLVVFLGSENDDGQTTDRTEPKRRPGRPGRQRNRNAQDAAPRPRPQPSRRRPDRRAGPSDDDIRRRAYERYQERGGNHGKHFDDWLEAEKELKK